MKRGPLEVVEHKTAKIPIYSDLHHGKPTFLVVHYSGGIRKRERFPTFEAARKHAKAKAQEIASGKAHAGSFTVEQIATINSAVELLRGAGAKLLPAVSEFCEARKILGSELRIVDACRHYKAFLEEQKAKASLQPITVPDLAKLFMEDLREREKSRRYTLDMQARLARISQAFTVHVASVQTDAIDLWLKGMKGVSGRTKNNYRAAMGTLFEFAKAKGFLPRGQATEVEFSVRYQDKGNPIGVYSPEQLSILLTNIERRFIPFVSIAAFAGVRSAEVCRLTWEDVRWKHGDIQLGAAKAKTASRRLVPILPCLRSWLEPFRKAKGPVLEGVRDEFALATQFKKAVDVIVDSEGKPLVQIIHNGLRHSFITYRLATEKNAAAVALEAGNSPKMIFEHYRELRTEAEGREWFSVMPTSGKVIAFSAA